MRKLMEVFRSALRSAPPLSSKFAAAGLIAGLAWWLGCAPHRHYRTNFQEISDADDKQRAASIITNGNYSLATIEFDDQGEFWDRRQLNNALRLIEQKGTNAPIMLMVYVHGWKHSAISTNYESFHRFVTNFAAVLPSIPEMKQFTVFGAYLSWRGGVLDGDSLWENLSIYNRWKAADRVGGPSCTEALFSLIGAVRGNEARRTGANTLPFWQQSKIVVIGHSMGARIVDTALSQAMLASILENGQKEADALKEIDRQHDGIKTNSQMKADLRAKIGSLEEELPELQRKQSRLEGELASLRTRQASDERFVGQFQARLAEIERHERTMAEEKVLQKRAEMRFEELSKARKSLEQLVRTNGCAINAPALPSPLAKPLNARKDEFDRLEKHGNDLSTIANTAGSNATPDNIYPDGSEEFFEALEGANSVILKELLPQIEARIEDYHNEEGKITKAEKSSPRNSAAPSANDFRSQRQHLHEVYTNYNASFQTELGAQARIISAGLQKLNAIPLLGSPDLAELAKIPPQEDTTKLSKPGLLMNQKYAGLLASQLAQAQALLAAKQEPLAKDIKAGASQISAHVDQIIRSIKADAAAAEAISERAEKARRETSGLTAQRDKEKPVYEAARQRIADFPREETRLEADVSAAKASLKGKHDEIGACEKLSGSCDTQIEKHLVAINNIKRKLKPLPADLVMLLNPAFTAVNSKKMISALKQERAQPFQSVVTEKALYGEKYVERQWKAPLMICISSTNDSATATLLPVAKNFSAIPLNFRKKQYREQSDEIYEIELARRVQAGDLKLPARSVATPGQRSFATRTAPHIESLLSHEITFADTNSFDRSEVGIIEKNLYQRAALGSNEPYMFHTPGKSWAIAPRENAWNQSPYWVMQAPDNLIQHHSKFWTPEFSGLLTGLFRIAHDLQKQTPRRQAEERMAEESGAAPGQSSARAPASLTLPAAQESAGSP